MKKSVIFLLLVMLSSCSKDYLFNRDQNMISKQLKEIKNTDSGVRSFNALMSYRFGIRDFNTVNDSLWDIDKYHLINTIDFSKIPSTESQIANFSQRKREAYDEFKLEGRALMTMVDEKNRKDLYQMVKKYGYPSFHNRKWKDTINARVGITYVLTHFNYDSNEEKKFLKLMIKEYLKGRVEEGAMKHFLWHVNGRNDGPPYDFVIIIEDWKKRVGL